MKNLTYILPLVLTLSACGGGGGGGDSGSNGSGTTPSTTPPVAGAPTTTPPATETPATPTNPATPAPSTPTDTPTTGTPSTGSPSTGTPTTGDPSTGTPTTGTPTTGDPSTGTPSTGTPSTPGTPDTAYPLDKYVGTHVSECVKGSRQRATYARAGSDSLTLALSLELFAKEDCSGAVIGTVSFTAPGTFKYVRTVDGSFYWLPAGLSGTTQTVPAAIDHFIVSAPASQTIFTGPGGSALPVDTTNGYRRACIKFDYDVAPFCKNLDEVIPAYTIQQGIALLGTDLYVGDAPTTTQPPRNTWYELTGFFKKQ